MAVINSKTRYRATSEQQKKLQRNIHLQAMAARHKLEHEEARKRQQTLDKLQAFGNGSTLLEGFIEQTMNTVDRLMGV